MTNLPFSDFSTLLGWLVTGGSLIVAAVFSSWYLELIPAFQKLSARIKQLVVLVIAAIIGCLAMYIQAHLDALGPVLPYLSMIIGLMGAWITMQKAHATNDVTRPGVALSYRGLAAGLMGSPDTHDNTDE